MRPARLIPAKVSFSVHFMESSIPELEETSQRLQRLAMEAIQSRAWGDRHQEFRRLLKSEPFQPKVPLDPVFYVPIADGLKHAALNAVKAWNRCKFPVRFKEDWGSIHGPARLKAPAMRTRAMHEGDHEEDTVVETEPNPWTCVVWEWRDGKYVPTYNYRITPAGAELPVEGEETMVMRKAMAMMDGEEEMPSVFDEILPGLDLLAVYEFHIALRLAFPLPDMIPSAKPGKAVLAPRSKPAGKAVKNSSSRRKSAARAAK